jgi:hypothetical protein
MKMCKKKNCSQQRNGQFTNDVQRATKVAAAVLKYANRQAGDADNAPITGNALI